MDKLSGNCESKDPGSGQSLPLGQTSGGDHILHNSIDDLFARIQTAGMKPTCDVCGRPWIMAPLLSCDLNGMIGHPSSLEGW
jgi:hypothetical protein